MRERVVREHVFGKKQTKTDNTLKAPGRSRTPVLIGPCAAQLRRSEEIRCIRRGMAVSECGGHAPAETYDPCEERGFVFWFHWRLLRKSLLVRVHFLTLAGRRKRYPRLP